MIDRCGRTAPFGNPVVPAVNTIHCFQSQPVVGSAARYLVFSQNPRITRARKIP